MKYFLLSFLIYFNAIGQNYRVDEYGNLFYYNGKVILPVLNNNNHNKNCSLRYNLVAVEGTAIIGSNKYGYKVGCFVNGYLKSLLYDLDEKYWNDNEILYQYLDEQNETSTIYISCKLPTEKNIVCSLDSNKMYVFIED